MQAWQQDVPQAPVACHSMGRAGHAQRCDLDNEHRMNMQASGYARDLFFDDGEAVG